MVGTSTTTTTATAAAAAGLRLIEWSARLAYNRYVYDDKMDNATRMRMTGYHRIPKWCRALFIMQTQSNPELLAIQRILNLGGFNSCLVVVVLMMTMHGASYVDKRLLKSCDNNSNNEM